MTTMGNGNAPEQAVDQQQVVKDLLALGKKNGRLTLKEIADALGQLDMESDDIDKLYETLDGDRDRNRGRAGKGAGRRR